MKVGICGSHGVGKTKVFNEIIHNLSGKIVINRICEIPRCVSQYFNDNDLLKKGNNTFAMQNIIMIYQLIEESTIVQKYNNSVLLSDRTLVDHLAYTLYLHNRLFSNGEAELLKMISKNYLKTYDIIFYIPIEFEIRGDSVRSSDRIFQTEIDNKIKHFIKEENTFTLSGSIKQRSATAIKIICKKYEKTRNQKGL